MHECIIDSRVEEIKPNERVVKVKSADAFNRFRSIFATWPQEGEPMFKQCVEHDIRMWKVTKMIKDTDDYAATTQILLKNSKLLVHLFIALAAKSNFPTIGLLDIGAFCQESHIIDAKFIASTVDRQFIASTTVNNANDGVLE